MLLRRGFWCFIRGFSITFHHNRIALQSTRSSTAMAASMALRALPSPTTCCSTHRSSCLTTTTRSDGAAFSSNSTSSAIRGLRVESKGFKTHNNMAVFEGVRCEAVGAEVGGGEAAAASSRVIHGMCFVVGDNIDTDQIIPAEYLTLVPSKPEEYEKLGSYAMIGLPARWGKFIEDGKTKTEYRIVIGGANFGCGSSREHAPVAMGAAGVRAVVAESYARIFFRNSVATGELYPVETQSVIWEENHTGDIVTVDMDSDILVNHTTGKTYSLKPIGEAGPVIDAGGIFAYARSTGMIASPAS